MRAVPAILMVVVALMLAGCTDYLQDDFVQEYVVESYLIAEQPLPRIRISATSPFNEFYSFDQLGVEEASVVVSLLDANGAVEAAYPYVQQQRGIFVPEEEGIAVLPLRRYRLEVQIPGSPQTIRATTIVPGTFGVISVNADTIGFRAPEQLEIKASRSEYPGRQGYYIFTTLALDTTNYDLTPFYAGLVERTDAFTRREFSIRTSGILNESNFLEPDGQLLDIRFPWIGIAFYGPNELVANALDDNMFDFVRSLSGNGAGSPGQIENTITNVEGGRGIFGSMSESRIRVYVRRQ
jgi:hypothetical protein